jgi:hypothetical protein
LDSPRSSSSASGFSLFGIIDEPVPNSGGYFVQLSGVCENRITSVASA